MKTQAADALITDPTTSHWLRDRLAEIDERDPVDAVNDCEVLLKIARLNYHQATAIDFDQHPPPGAA